LRAAAGNSSCRQAAADYNPYYDVNTVTANTFPANLMDGAEPFHFNATGNAACLLVHGFTGSPNEVRDLGRHLAEQGVTARGVLLSGHGTRPEEMARSSYQDWLEDVESALDELLQENRPVFICGLSMGGTLALNIAARRAHDPRLAGVIAIAAPLRLVDWRLSFVPVARLVARWQSWGNPDIKDEKKWAQHVAYRRFHVRALVQLLRLVRETRQIATRVRQPLLVIQSRQDNTVPPFNADLIMSLVQSQDRQLVWLDNCYHVVTLDYESETVSREIATFIQNRSKRCAPETQ
jgi:carboxylesterase